MLPVRSPHDAICLGPRAALRAICIPKPRLPTSTLLFQLLFPSSAAYLLLIIMLAIFFTICSLLTYYISFATIKFYFKHALISDLLNIHITSALGFIFRTHCNLTTLVSQTRSNNEIAEPDTELEHFDFIYKTRD